MGMSDSIARVLLCCLCVALSTPSAAAAVPKARPGQLPGAGMPPMQGMTPQQASQLQQYWALQALQGRGGGRGVQTGYPPQINFGGPNVGGQAAGAIGAPGFDPTQNVSGKKTSAQRRAEAKQLRIERKRQLREAALERRNHGKSQPKATKQDNAAASGEAADKP